MFEPKDPTTAQSEQAETYAREAIARTPELVEVWGYTQGKIDPGYAEWTLALAHAYWLANTPEADRERFPFCEDCGDGHDQAKITCEELDEIRTAEAAIGA